MRRETLVLLLLGLSIEVSLIAMWGETRLDRTSSLLESYYAIPFTVYLLAVVWITRSSSKGSFKSSFVAITLVSVAMYLTFMLQQSPTLSGDIYRYLWDGKLGLS